MTSPLTPDSGSGDAIARDSSSVDSTAPLAERAFGVLKTGQRDEAGIASTLCEPPRPQKFWMVVRHDNQGTAPTKQHATRDSAEAEARRLVAKERAIFCVLEAVSKHSSEFTHLRVEFAA